MFKKKQQKREIKIKKKYSRGGEFSRVGICPEMENIGSSLASDYHVTGICHIGAFLKGEGRPQAILMQQLI